MQAFCTWTTRVLALTALGLSAYLAYAGLSVGEVLGCSWGAFDCDAALSSRWGKWLGIPVAMGGVLCYAIALLGALLAGQDVKTGTLGWRLLEGASALAVGSGVWFVVVQAAWLESFCLYCLATHTCGALMALSGGVWRANAPRGRGQAWPIAAIASVDPASSPPPSDDERPRLFGGATLVGLAGVAALVAGQLSVAPATSVTLEPTLEQTVDLTQPPGAGVRAPSTTEPIAPPEPVVEAAPERVTATAPARRKRRANGSREVRLLRGVLKIDAYEHPILGSPEAKHIVVEMMDYACPHCREFHEKLQEAIDRFSGDVAVIVMPVPGDISCNPYVRKARATSVGACDAARLAVAVAMLAPEEFESFHHWMLQDDSIPQRTAMRLEAWRHVDRKDLSRLLRGGGGEPAQNVNRYVELAAKLQKKGRFALPSQIVGDKLVVGSAKTVDEICQQWAEAFGVEAPATDLPF